PVEIRQTVFREECLCAAATAASRSARSRRGRSSTSTAAAVAAGHPSVEAAVSVRDPFPVVDIDGPPLFETNIVRNRYQFRLAFHRSQLVAIEVDQQLFP